MGLRGYIAVCVCLALAAFVAVASTPMPDTHIYTPREAGTHAGQTITVEGRASIYAAKNGTTFIDLGGTGTASPFAAVVFQEDAKTFPNIFDYDGKTIRVNGLVRKFRGKPQITLKSTEQIQVRK